MQPHLKKSQRMEAAQLSSQPGTMLGSLHVENPLHYISFEPFLFQLMHELSPLCT